ncbi:MAG: multifunctional oxoglutarate decarboxylase/oxoglutarate dehydrogenase thiamine pyrophosphate-binding subunit/dihydrolipoyllysine-residue succinyltransferase subunit [Bacteroidetes bacterium]|nr:multifunctional oxoglutarate decarboxylase/oxoglutarate dehydrogenase thiamine pyrophosphate-binding subunit/dihydrolipoyllysine-residue succinyltransferase subunit [Bacteroidota bacterium]
MPIRGAGIKIIENMDSSLSIPVATSLRTVPVKVLEENRNFINNHFKKRNLGKISFTHIIGWAIVKALKTIPVMNNAYTIIDGESVMIKRHDVNIGLAIDIVKKDGSRSLIVPNIKKADSMNFRQFFDSYNNIITKARTNKIEVSDFMETTISLTNPGTLGTSSSSPRLMLGQGCIIATGSIGYPPGFEASSNNVVSSLGLSRVMNITSTYDHRIIQGAESGLFLKKIHELLAGEDNFYDEIFEDLGLLVKPVKWNPDSDTDDFDSSLNIKEVEKYARVIQLMNMYRVRGHLLANLDPLHPKAMYHPELDPSYYGFTVWDYDRKFFCDGLGGYKVASLRNILDMLHQTYCDNIGVEYRHIQDPEEKQWLQNNMEAVRNKPQWNNDFKKNTLYKLIQAETFEKFIDKKYLGHKRFSLEGSETLIPVLDFLINDAGNDRVEEIVLGMAHRGRLNVLANIIGKPLESIFSEFEDIVDLKSTQGSGDVKYHLGAAGLYRTISGNDVRVSVVSNPSHLEFVNPVVEGIVRAKQKKSGDEEKSKIIPLLIHGDAAFAGEGIVAETLNLSQLTGYSTGGTIHVIVNNQIGFTTPPVDARSTVYASDVAKMIQAPIFHVNGDDPESCMWVAKLAYEFRMKFGKDVVIDIFSYRRLGHNETDEPAFTQPVMYSLIKKHASVKEIYGKQLLGSSVVTDDEIKNMENEIVARMDTNYSNVKKDELSGNKDFNEILMTHDNEEVEKIRGGSGTSISNDYIETIVNSLTRLPEGFNLHPKLKKFLDARKDFLEKDSGADWATAEALAFGSMLLDGIPVRLSGQDVSRGTFSQRHAVLTDVNSEKEFIPLNSLGTEAKIEPVDSLLSEAAVLGFEYGHTTTDPVTMVIWEAQFGDFANAAQVVIDNFIVSSFTKWKLQNHLVMLLPHGLEGQGSEHSSARLERFLTLCAEDNMYVCNPTTPAQYFHLLRRQAKSPVRKPMVILSPKSLLRHAEVKSYIINFTNGKFEEVIDDSSVAKDKAVKIILTSGKVYYDLLKYRNDNGISDTAIVRLEQYYPFPDGNLKNILAEYKHAKEIRWVQEEPENMGALGFVRTKIAGVTEDNLKFSYVSRKESASPAPGSYKVYAETQKIIIQKSFE